MQFFFINEAENSQIFSSKITNIILKTDQRLFWRNIRGSYFEDVSGWEGGCGKAASQEEFTSNR